MKEYKRFTEEKHPDRCYYNQMNFIDVDDMYDCLAQLEDKIQQQELVSLKSVAKILNQWWDCPCNFRFDEQDVADYMYEKYDDWCEENCDKMMEDSTGCWEMLLKAKLKELQGGK